MYNRFQQQAIDTENKDILVSAGAGSGKTSVMIERIARNLINGNANIDEILVVTFTNAAAGEMRQKLERKLNEKLLDTEYKDQHKRILEQLDLLGQSDICTLHKFCQKIIQKYFYTIDLDPSFAIGEESETAVLRTRAVNDVLRENATKKTPEFMLLSHTFDDKRNFDKIKSYIFKIHDFLVNQPDIDEFRRRVDEAYSGDLDTNKLTAVINKYMVEMFEYYVQAFADFREDAQVIGYDDMVNYLNNLIPMLELINRNNTFSKNHFVAFNFPKIEDLRVKAYSPETEELKNQIKKLKEKFSEKLRNLRDKILISDNLDKIKQDLAETRQVLNAMFALVEQFETRYMKIKKERNILDFSDLEHYAYQILSLDEVNREIRNRYKLIFVDEYQDINDIQEGIISKVHSGKDLFLVGDIKQSIYGFRGTNPQIFLDKKIAFASASDESTVAIDLNYNYRTDQRILDFVNFIFGRLMTKQLGEIDYLPDNEMTSDVEFKSVAHSMPQIEIDIVNKDKDDEDKEKLTPNGVYRVSTAPLVLDEEKDFARSEGVIIAEKITQFMSEQKVIYDAKDKCERPISFSDITLLCRGRSDSVNTILDVLGEYGIPVAQLSKDSVYNEYEVQILVAYLNLLNNPYNDIYLTAFLTSPIIDLDENSLACVRACAPACDNYYECIYEYTNKDDDIACKINRALDLIESGAERLVNDNIYNVLNWFVEITHYYAFVSALPDGKNRVKNVQGFINGFNGKRYNTDLSEYLSSIAENEDDPKISPEHTLGADVVKVETMHHSKGLEYPIVFLIDTGHGFNKEDKKGDFLLNNNLGVGLYKYDTELRTKTPTVSLSAIKIAIDNKEFADNLRLLYVAMTRAKNHLIITGCCDTKKLKANTSAFAMKSRNNFLEVILSALSPMEISGIANGRTNLIVPLAENTNLNIEVRQKIDYSGSLTATVSKKLENHDINAKFSDYITKNNGYVYKFRPNTNLALKNTVTALNRETEEYESINTMPVKFEMKENSQFNAISTEQGIAYHKAMQLIDFDLPSVDAVKVFLLNKLTERENEFVDANKIWAAIKQIRPLLEGARVYREQQFMMRARHCDLVQNSEITDFILVQGVIDLIIVKNNEIILLDYKTSGSHNIEKTAQNYIMQLNCYEKAISGAMHAKVSKKFLYFFLQERLILIDK